ncbi:MAG: putative large, multifunctional secreted protein [Labilithrix sp.]|nr:putative large, multifunctional secreted protein [Labilithrix sp.]
MRKLSFPVAFVVAAVSTVVTAGCSFQVGSKPDPNTPQGGPAPAPAPAAPAPASAANPPPKPVLALGRTKHPTPVPGTPATPGTPAPATGIPVLAGTNVFGQGTADPAGWKGSFFVIPPATQKVPALATMTPTGVLFAKELNVPSKAMTGGFPGIDATRNENFAIRWEAPLIVDTEADYTLRIVSDDGSIVSIDNTPIVDNDGAHNAQEKAGPVHLVKGAHVITVDYFQGSGSVALQLFCKKAGGTETICPTHLL